MRVTPSSSMLLPFRVFVRSPRLLHPLQGCKDSERIYRISAYKGFWFHGMGVRMSRAKVLGSVLLGILLVAIGVGFVRSGGVVMLVLGVVVILSGIGTAARAMA